MMIFIPTWMTNLVFLATVYLSGFQHVQLKRPNPITNLQFIMIVFALLMMLIVTLYNSRLAWRSDVFFAVAVACLGLMIRQQRMLPPMKSFE